MSEEKYFKFNSEIDGLEIDALKVIPRGSPVAVVQLAHGMCEYKERYLDFMRYLAERGYLCVINDHRGHGKSVRSAEHLGHMYEGGARGLVEDVRTLMGIVKEETGGDIPYFLLGHSMGSLIVRSFAKRYDTQIDKLAVVGSPSNMPGKTLGIAMAKAAAAIKGGTGRLKILDRLTVGGYLNHSKSDEIKNTWVNSDKEAADAYARDPLCGYTLTINGYENLIRLTKDVYKIKDWNLENPDLPIYFFSGEDDPFAISKKAFAKSAESMRRAGYRNVRAKMYPGMRHEVLNETERARVFEDIVSFFEEV